MKKGKHFSKGMNLVLTALLFAVSAALAYGQEGSARQVDQCAEKLAGIGRLEAEASEISGKIPSTKGKEQQSLLKQMEQIWPQMVELIKGMRSLGCPNTPDTPISGSRSGGAMPGVEGPGGEGVAEYEVGPDRRSLSGFRAFVKEAQVEDAEEAEGACGDLSGMWRITTSEGSFTWRLWEGGAPRVYGGRESGKRDGRGFAALMQGNVLRLQFDVEPRPGEIFGGTYNCQLDANCQSGRSPCTLTYDLTREGSFEATIKRQQE
jgi:hypothetical protein